LGAFASRLAIEIARGVRTAVSEIEKNAAIEASAAHGAYMGHDMKTPIQVLVNVVPAVRLRITRLRITDSVLLGYVKKCEDAVTAAREKASQLEAMPVREFVVRTRKKRLDLVSLLDGVVALANGLGSARNVSVQWLRRPSLPVFCDLDHRYMLVALHAVLDNAVKFSFGSMTVDVTVDEDTGRFVIMKICNLGVGIPQEKQIAIFDFYTRGEVADAKPSFCQENHRGTQRNHQYK
jgi:signal transduction histidine kinase